MRVCYAWNFRGLERNHFRKASILARGPLLNRNKQRLLPVPSSAEALLKELIQNKKDDEYLFVGRNQVNKPLSVASFNETLRAKARKARIKIDISSHTFRRSLLTKLISKGYNRGLQKVWFKRCLVRRHKIRSWALVLLWTVQFETFEKNRDLFEILNN